MRLVHRRKGRQSQVRIRDRERLALTAVSLSLPAPPPVEVLKLLEYNQGSWFGVYLEMDSQNIFLGSQAQKSWYLVGV